MFVIYLVSVFVSLTVVKSVMVLIALIVTQLGLGILATLRMEVGVNLKGIDCLLEPNKPNYSIFLFNKLPPTFEIICSNIISSFTGDLTRITLKSSAVIESIIFVLTSSSRASSVVTLNKSTTYV